VFFFWDGHVRNVIFGVILTGELGCIFWDGHGKNVIVCVILSYNLGFCFSIFIRKTEPQCIR